MQKILIDADTGIDDSIAILFALKQPVVRVVGVTTGCGNTSAAQAAENTLRLIGREACPQLPMRCIIYLLRVNRPSSRA